MTTREQRLVAAVAAAGVLWGATRGLSRYRDAVQRNEAVARRAADALDDAEFAVARGERARRRVNDWGARSLPADRDVARSLYEDWLRAQLVAAGLEVEQIADKTLNRQAVHYGELSFEAKAAGTLAQLADFLYKFYAAPHLHRISSATLAPIDNGAKLTITLGVDGLIIPGIERDAALAVGEPLPLDRTLDDLRTSLASRNVFAPHAPGAVAAAGASDAKVSALVSDGQGGWILWIRAGEPAKTHRFRVGDTISFGPFTATYVAADDDSAILETPAGRVEVRLDQKLTDAKPPAEPAT